MNENLFTTLAACQAVFTFLLRQTLHSALLLLLISPLLFILRKKSVHWQMGLYSLIMLRLLLPPDLYSPFSLTAAFGRFTAGIPSAAPVFPHAFAPLMNAMTAQVSQADANPSFFPLAVFAVLFWLVGLITLTIRYIVVLARAHSRIRQCAPVHDPSLLALVENWKKRFHITRTVQLLSCADNLSPFTVGYFRSKIIIPALLLNAHDAGMIACIISHEMAHIRRHDNLLIKLQAGLQIIYFFNPLVWFVASRINLLRECLCDGLAIRVVHKKPQGYYVSLLRVLQQMNKPGSVMPAMAELGSTKRKMTFRFINHGGPMKKSHRVLFWFIFILLAITLLPMAAERSAVRADYLPEALVENPETTMSDTDKPDVGIDIFNAPLKSWQTTLGFGPAKHPYTGKIWDHSGIDLKAPLDEEVLAVADGEVVKAVNEYEKDKGPGKYVVLRHSVDKQSRYTHLNSLCVKAGDQVRQGQCIGKVGITGLSTGPHLHLEIWENDQAVDPVKYIPALRRNK